MVATALRSALAQQSKEAVLEHQPARARQRANQTPHSRVGIFPSDAVIDRLVGAVLQLPGLIPSLLQAFLPGL